MFEQLSASERTIAIQRLTALWAFNECGLGGILHAVQSPFTGLLVGSIAMVCIAFIAMLAENKWTAVITSLFIVLAIKGLVSPHTSPTAYLAVTFQAVTGALIFRYVPGLLFGSMFFVSLGLLESAAQKLFTLTILYGNTLWQAIDIWGEWVNKQWGILLPMSSSWLVIYTYLLIHLVVGLLVGWFIYKIIKAVHHQWGDARFQLTLGRDDRKDFLKKEKKKGFNWKRFAGFFMLMSFVVAAYLLNPASGDFGKGLLAALRSILLLLVWYLFLAPLFVGVIQKYLARKHQSLASQIAHTMDMIPSLAWILDKAWKESKSGSFIRRWKTFLLHSLLYILQYKSSDDPYPDRPHPQS